MTGGGLTAQKHDGRVLRSTVLDGSFMVPRGRRCLLTFAASSRLLFDGLPWNLVQFCFCYLKDEMWKLWRIPQTFHVATSETKSPQPQLCRTFLVLASCWIDRANEMTYYFHCKDKQQLWTEQHHRRTCRPAATALKPSSTQTAHL